MGGNKGRFLEKCVSNWGSKYSRGQGKVTSTWGD